MEEVEMYHPELDETVKVREKAVPILKRSGWRRVEETQDVREDEEEEE